MLSSIARNLNTTYVQNNYFGMNRGPVILPYNNFPNPPSWSGGCSVFNFPMPSYNPFWGGGFMMNPFGGNFMMPFFGCWGGFGNRFFDMIMSMQLFQMTMNSFTNLANSLSKVRTPSHSYNYSTTPASTVRRSNYSKNFNIITKTSLPQLQDIGYSSKKGKKLAEAALSNSVGFTGYCAKYVRMALEKAGLSNGMRADAADYNTVLSMNKNFKEISADGINLSSLPAGCILVYDRGKSGYSSQYGHVEITTGSGQAVSDGITTNIRPGARVYVPV